MQYEHRTTQRPAMPKHLAGSNGSTSNKIYGQLVGSLSPSGARPNHIGKSIFRSQSTKGERGSSVHTIPRYAMGEPICQDLSYECLSNTVAGTSPICRCHVTHSSIPLSMSSVPNNSAGRSTQVQKGSAENNAPYLRLNESRSTSGKRLFNLFFNPEPSEPRAQEFSSRV